MSEQATITVAAFQVKEGAKNGRPWKRWTLKDSAGEYYSTFVPAVGDAIAPFEGKRALIEWSPNGDFKDLVSITAPNDAGPEPPDEAPALGTGDYVRGQTAPKDKRSIWASVALNNAARASTTGTWEEIQPLANSMFVWLLIKNDAMTDEDIPF